MQRRCTESTCRRVFPIGHAAPVRCPYCGTSYPRVRPDPRALRETYGYSVRTDFTEMSAREIQQLVSRCRWPRYICYQSRAVAVGHGLSQREAQALCRRFRLQGIPADMITTWDAQRQHLVFFRIQPDAAP